VFMPPKTWTLSQRPSLGADTWCLWVLIERNTPTLNWCPLWPLNSSEISLAQAYVRILNTASSMSKSSLTSISCLHVWGDRRLVQMFCERFPCCFVTMLSPMRKCFPRRYITCGRRRVFMHIEMSWHSNDSWRMLEKKKKKKKKTRAVLHKHRTLTTSS
jgi:hypothetical protein